MKQDRSFPQAVGARLGAEGGLWPPWAAMGEQGQGPRWWLSLDTWGCAALGTQDVWRWLWGDGGVRQRPRLGHSLDLTSPKTPAGAGGEASLKALVLLVC